MALSDLAKRIESFDYNRVGDDSFRNGSVIESLEVSYQDHKVLTFLKTHLQMDLLLRYYLMEQMALVQLNLIFYQKKIRVLTILYLL